MKKTFFLLIAFVFFSCGGDDSAEAIVQSEIIETTILEITNISDFSAEISVSVVTNSENTITEKGLVWSTNVNPTMSDNTSQNGTGANNYSTVIEGLVANTLYNVRSYLIVGDETIYSTNQAFTTTNECEQNVYDGTIRLESQQDVIDFGLNNYCQITGFLIVNDRSDGQDPILDLSPLNTLISVGNLTVSINPLLSTLDGLENITFIGNTIQIDENENLVSIDGLRNVSSSVSAIFIRFNSNLSNINGITGITEVKRNSLAGIKIIDNESLNDISGLSNISYLEAPLEIINNDSLESLIGLEGLTFILNGYLEIVENNALQNLNGLNNITDISEGVLIEGNSSLVTLEGLNSLITSDGSLLLKRNKNLSSLSGLSNLNNLLGDLFIENNVNLLNLNGLEALSSISSLRVLENTVLIDHCGLTNLVTQNGIQGEYIVNNNAYNPTQQDIIDGNCSQ